MHMCRTKKVDTPEGIRAELSKFISETRRTISEEKQKRGNGYEVGNPPPVLVHLQANV